MGRLLAIGDIHGCLTALMTLQKCVPILDDDLVVSLGDYVDRGPNSREVIDWMIGRHATGKLIPLRGNHEIMMCDSRSDEDVRRTWLAVGGVATLASYHPGVGGELSHVPAAHWDFIENKTLPYFETETHLFVHAGVDADLALSDQFDEALYWRKFYFPPPHCSGKTMICGHTAQREGVPLNIGHAVCIDTWVYGQGWLTCLNPANGEYWQANQHGESRRGMLHLIEN